MRQLPTAALALALALTGCGPATPASIGPSPDSRVGRDTGGFFAREYAGAEGGRPYRLMVPAGAASRPHPLLVLLHGCTQSAEELARGTRMNRYAAEQGLLVAYPEQPVAHHPKKCWNWYEPAHQSAGRGEPAIIAGIVRQVAGEFPVDPERIYIGGISAGGAMAVVVALAYPDIFAAVGSHSGVGWKVASDVMSGLAAMQGRGPAPGESAALAWEAMGATRRFVPLIAFHGGSDKVVNPAATDLLVNQFVALRGLSGSKVRVDSLPDAGGGRSYLLLRFQDADGRTAIEQWFVPELGHALSGGSAEGTWTDPSGPDAAREMLRFFLEHPRGEH